MAKSQTRVELEPGTSLTMTTRDVGVLTFPVPGVAEISFTPARQAPPEKKVWHHGEVVAGRYDMGPGESKIVVRNYNGEERRFLRVDVDSIGDGDDAVDHLLTREEVLDLATRLTRWLMDTEGVTET